MLGVGSKFEEFLISQGLANNVASTMTISVIQALSVRLFLPAMPIQDAIDLAHFLADTAAKFTQFSLRSPTVGGPIEVATITKHEGFKWVNRKHYFSTILNPEQQQ